jgi:hypothetical protein
MTGRFEPSSTPDPNMQFRFEVALGGTGVCDGDELPSKLANLNSFAEAVVIGLGPHV